MKILPCERAVEEAVKTLNRPGGVLLVPTETVYGLVCGWKDESARKRIYELKHRSENKPFAAFLPDLSVLPDAAVLPEAARRLAERFCPGPITIVVPDRNGSTFGFRLPDHPFIQQLLQAYGGPLASTSANLSGQPPARNVEYALQSIDGEPDLTVDGGTLPPDSSASTVVQVFHDS
ncbi:MAG: threonylcarbamoyl-AMP synthase, partial [Lentisphaeria bacterium]|nr:threonylcarbamoyl-AMP synthase [Lentisphaeria bacterium]